MIAAFDFGQQADGPNTVLVHCVMVIHVELHLCDHTPEIGHKAAKNGGFVHPPQHRFGVAR